MRKNILVTGCSRGLGLQITKQLLESGYNVYGISRTFNEELNMLVNHHPNSFFHLIYDLANVDSIKEIVFKNFIPNSTKIYAFVNNAAVAYDDILTNASYQKLAEMYHVNVFSPIMMTKYVIRNMLLSKPTNGKIIHISSISVHTGYKGLSMYASTKGALEAFSKNTSREWGHIGVKSNCIVAGFMETEMSSTLSELQKSKIYNRTSLRKETDVNSVAATVLFLISEDSRSITGQNIFVDSGTI